MNAPMEFPPLNVEMRGDGLITLIDPTDTGDGAIYVVSLHPVQLRWLAEQQGLIREVSASEADMLQTARGQVAALQGEISRMGRNMMRIHGMIGEAQEALRNADWAHADLSHEMWVLNELATTSEVVIDNTPSLSNASSVTNALAQGYPGVSTPCTNGAVTVHDSSTNRARTVPANATERSANAIERQAQQGHAASRHVTPSHDDTSRSARDNGVTDHGHPRESRVTGVDLSAGQVRDGGGVSCGTATGQDRDTATLSEALSLDLFRRLVRENAANLKQVAHWGDGACGELLCVLQQELLGLPESATPKVYSDDLLGLDWALSQKLDKSSQRFLLAVLAYRAEAGRVSQTTRELADLTGQDRKTVADGLKRLADLGLIEDTGERTGADNKVPVFRLAMEKRIEAEKTAQLELGQPENGGTE